MMGLTDDLPVTLVIKAPNQRMADHTVECQPTWTIKKLKQHLESVYPSKPKHNEQRLIYSGRLLQDHLTLKEILRQFDSTEDPNKHTVHLVCSTQNEPKPSPNKQHTERNPPPPSSTPSEPSSQTDGLRHRSTATPSTPVVSSSQYTGTPEMYYQAMGQAGTEYTPEQYMAMQQQLYSQYMMQYMQYYQSAFYPYQSFNAQAGATAFFPQAFLPTPPNPQAGQPAPPQAPEANNAPRAGAARQNVRMNAQGGMEEDDEDDGEPRDWLHHTYFLMRFLAFMGILFFYSNVTRFLVVFSGSFAIYILQKLRKFMQRREQEQQRQAAQEQANNPENGGNQQQGQGQQQADRNGQPQQNPPPPPEQPGQAEAPPQQQPPGVVREQQQQQPRTEGDQQRQQPVEGNDQQQQPGAQLPEEGRLARLFVFACNTIQTFFTSLVPAPPELLDAN